MTSTIFLGALTTATLAGAAGQPAITMGPWKGAPALFIAGEPTFPLFHFSQEILDPYARGFHEAGFHFYGTIEEHSFLDLGWVGDHQFDFSKLDKVLNAFQRRLPDSWVMPKIHLWAPEWWIDKHPEEAVGLLIKPDEYTYVIGSGPKHESFASERWQEEAGEGLRQMVRHILAAPYADRVLGIMVAGGTFGEWLPYAVENVPDTSEPMRRAFVRYARAKYANDTAALRRVWNDPNADFDTIAVPDLAALRAAARGLFRDPVRSRRVIDYLEAFHQVSLDLLDRFCRIVKDESGGRLLTCVNYAYQPDMPYVPQEIRHADAARAMRLASIDMFSSPHSYWHRGLGEHGAVRHFPESLIARGRLFIDEADERTHLASPQLFRKADNLWESQQILWRSFNNVVTHGIGMWYMDHTSRAWYDDPAFFADFTRIRQWGDVSMALPRTSVAEVAVIASLQSEFYVAAEGDVTAQFHVNLTDQFMRAGAPFDRYLIEDLEDGLVPDRRVYVFLDTLFLTPGQRAAVERLRKDGRTLMWFFAPGYVTPDGLSLEAMESLTGIHFTLDDAPFSTLRMDRARCPDAPETFQTWREHFGPIKALAPRFIPDDSACEVWATYDDTGRPAIVTKALDGWHSVYCPAGNLPWAALRDLLRRAGVHLYCESGENLTANSAWVGIHAVTQGPKRLSLPRPSPVYDAIHDKLIGEAVDHFDVDLRAGETGLYLLAMPPAAKEE